MNRPWALVPALALALLGTVGGDDLAVTLRSLARAYLTNVAAIARVTGRDTTMDYYNRLMEDVDLSRLPPPAGYSPEVWQRSVRAESDLDASLATQLINASFRPMAEIRGAGETFVRSSKDGTMQPVGVYVPTTYSPQRPASLVVFLHGWMQPESRLVAPEYLRQIADANGSIVVAPYGRGYYDFNGSASDVYDAAAAATSAFTIDSHRRYLAGYSMGGYSVYNVGPMRPHDWTAVMSVAGSLLGSRGPRLLASMPSTRFYVLTGAHDDIVPTAFPTATAIYLRDAGVPVSFYSAPDGTHALYTLRAILAQAWGDMERGAVRTPAGLTGAANLPEAVP